MLLQWSPESTNVPKKAPSLLGEQKIPPPGRRWLAKPTVRANSLSYRLGGGENQQPMQLLRQNSLVVKAVMFFHYEQPFSCVEAACHTTGSD